MNNRSRRLRLRKRNYEYIGKIKENGKCLMCLSKNNLTFHHRKPKNKKDNVQELASKGLSLKRVHDEIQKCDLLCIECHILVHKIGINKYNKFKKFLFSQNKL